MRYILLAAALLFPAVAGAQIQYSAEWTGRNSWSGAIGAGSNSCTQTVVNTIWRDGEVRVQEIDPLNTRSTAMCSGGKPWATLPVPAAAVPPGISASARPMPGLRASNASVAGNWLFATFLVYDSPGANDENDGTYALFARYHDPAYDYCNGWSNDWLRLGPASIAPTATKAVGGTYNGRVFVFAGDEASFQSERYEQSHRVSAWIMDDSSRSATHLPRTLTLDDTGIDYISARVGAVVKNDQWIVVLNRLQTSSTIDVANHLWIFGGPVTALSNTGIPLLKNSVQLPWGYRPVTAPALILVGNDIVGAIGTDSAGDLTEIYDPIGPVVPFTIRPNWGNTSMPFPATWLPPITIKDNLGYDVLLPNHSMPILGRSSDGAVALYHFSQWDSSIMRIKFPLTAWTSTSTNVPYLQNTIVPFSQTWVSQTATPACPVLPSTAYYGGF